MRWGMVVSGWLARLDVWRVLVVIVMCIGGLLGGQAVVTAQPGDNATLTLTPPRGTCTTEVTAHGDGYIPGSTVDIFAGLNGGDSFFPAAEADVTEDGSFEVPLPMDFIFGECRGGLVYGGEQEYKFSAETQGTDGGQPYALAIFTFLSGNPQFYATWARSDYPVAQGDAARTWIWGPEPITDVIEESYAESSDGQRIVQYYDKSRMVRLGRRSLSSNCSSSL